jgi:hypothetical protein
MSVGNAEVKRHDVNKRRLRQHNPTGTEIGSNLEQESISTNRHAAGIKQRPAIAAAIRIQGEGFESLEVGTLQALQTHLHAGSGATAHGIEHMGTEMAHKKFSFLNTLNWT